MNNFVYTDNNTDTPKQIETHRSAHFETPDDSIISEEAQSSKRSNTPLSKTTTYTEAKSQYSGWRPVYDSDNMCSGSDMKRGGRLKKSHSGYNARLDRSLSEMIISGDLINESVKKRQTAYNPSLAPKSASGSLNFQHSNQTSTSDNEYDEEELRNAETPGPGSKGTGHKKLRLRDLYRELRLMRQLMAACAGPEGGDQGVFQDDDKHELTEEEEAERLRENQELLRTITSDIIMGRTKDCGLEDDDLLQESDDEEDINQGMNGWLCVHPLGYFHYLTDHTYFH